MLLETWTTTATTGTGGANENYMIVLFCVLIIAMVLTAVATTSAFPSSALLLIPSQVKLPPSSTTTLWSSGQSEGTYNTLTPKTVPPSVPKKPSRGKKRSKRRRKKNKKKPTEQKTTTTPSDTTASLPQQKPTSSPYSFQPFPLQGNHPNVYWRSIPLSHLRSHPQFRPLSRHITTSSSLTTPEDVRLFRQDSWQWDALHVGRCTSSQAVAALGFLQPCVAAELRVPKSWKARTPFLHLQQEGLRTVEEMRQVLFQSPPESDYEQNEEESSTKDIWSVPNSTTGDSPPLFAADYTYIPTQSDRLFRRKVAREKFATTPTLDAHRDMGRDLMTSWGSLQEATTVLIALNYFTRHVDPGVVLEEVGMCGAGITMENGLLVGATPDGIVRYSNGTMEALEVKSHCPFRGPFLQRAQRRRNGNKKFAVSSYGGFDNGPSIFPYYVPQLQLEMYCLGPECQSVVMVRSTARYGALIVRMYRDEEWMEEMLYWMGRFQTDFVKMNVPPPNNFFWETDNGQDQARYRKFIHKTKQVCHSKVELVAQLEPHEIQRAEGCAPFFLDES